MRTILQCAICSALLLGCAPVYKFSKSDASVSNFKRDVYECNHSIVNTYALQRMGTAAGSMFFEGDMNRCLTARGWTQTADGKYGYHFDIWFGEAVVE